jgi:two-component system chemotaxis response regulator CheB
VANRDIIVVGGSSGATVPLKAILGRLRGDLQAAMFIVLHIPSRSTGILATVASSVASLPVRQAEDGMTIQPGCIYLGVPDHHLLLDDGKIRLGRGPRENMVRPAIDPLFRSAAAAYGPRVIGVVLSGLLSDGAAGLNAIKRCGGMTVVQDPTDAIADEMPLRALEATMADFCAPAATLGDVLSELVREEAGPRLPVPPEIRLEVDIAAGERINSELLRHIADPVPLSCPACGGVLSEIKSGQPVRFRCQVGHAYTADILTTEQESHVDEALRVALRIIEERAELVSRMAVEARQAGRGAIAALYEQRTKEYRAHAETVRRVVLASFERAERQTKKSSSEAD